MFCVRRGARYRSSGCDAVAYCAVLVGVEVVGGVSRGEVPFILPCFVPSTGIYGSKAPAADAEAAVGCGAGVSLQPAAPARTRANRRGTRVDIDERSSTGVTPSQCGTGGATRRLHVFLGDRDLVGAGRDASDDHGFVLREREVEAVRWVQRAVGALDLDDRGARTRTGLVATQLDVIAPAGERQRGTLQRFEHGRGRRVGEVEVGARLDTGAHREGRPR